MCIHVNTRVLPVVMSFERVWCESYWVRTGTVSLVRVITWKTRYLTVNTCRHTKCVHRIRWIHVNWASWTREFTYRNCKITGCCLLGTHSRNQTQHMSCHSSCANKIEFYKWNILWMQYSNQVHCLMQINHNLWMVLNTFTVILKMSY